MKLKKIAAVAALGGALIFGGNIPADAATPNDGLWAFREAYTAQVPNTRAFEQDLTLIAPTFHLDIDSQAQIFNDGSVRMGGQFNWTYTNLKKKYSTNNTIPFYIEQIDNEMTLYVQRRGKWSKMLLPGLPAGIALIWKTTDPAMIQENIAAVKAVEVLKDDNNIRIMKVTLDGEKIADILQRNGQASFANLSGDALAEQREIFNRWIAAFRSSDIIFNWAVNKPSWTTATASFDLTTIMQAYARYVLNESAAGRVVLSDEERELLDAVGYYSELKSYTTRIDPDKNINMVTLPANVRTAPENDDSLNDIFYEMTTVVQN